jgi:hypothetical protein
MLLEYQEERKVFVAVLRQAGMQVYPVEVFLG